MNNFTLNVTLKFTKDDIETILDDVNIMCLDDEDNPITIEELQENQKLQDFVVAKLAESKNEIVGQVGNDIADGWLDGIEDYR